MCKSNKFSHPFSQFIIVISWDQNNIIYASIKIKTDQDNNYELFCAIRLIETLNLLKIKIFDKGCPCAAIKRFLNKNIDFKKEKKNIPVKSVSTALIKLYEMHPTLKTKVNPNSWWGTTLGQVCLSCNKRCD